MSSTRLQLAIQRGMQPAGDLADELSTLSDYEIESAADAHAICDALAQLPLPADDDAESSFYSPVYALTGLFQQVESVDSDAYDVLVHDGTGHLIRIFDQSIDAAADDGVDDLLFVIKILAMYGSQEGTEKVIEAARRPLNPDAYMWSVILSMYSHDHPQQAALFAALRDPLPPGFLAVALLDAVNRLLIEGYQMPHPFDSEEGKQRLEGWLAAPDPEEFSYAHSATAALPFISNPQRSQLLALAMDHPDHGVQMEAAWASARLGSEAGLKLLARACLDVRHAMAACRYLEELEREDVIPEQANDPDFMAQAEFANWLSHPNELGRPPDELQVVDTRELAWPPDGERKPFWLIKYRATDTTGEEPDDVDCGLVGSITFCLFSYKLAERPPEDAYAIHCYWEMQTQQLIEEAEPDADDPEELELWLQQWNGPPLEDPQWVQTAVLAPELAYPQEEVALLAAQCDGQPGWAVLDGSRSAWYAAQDVPNDVPDSTVLAVHVGRQLLGFRGMPDRQRYLSPVDEDEPGAT